MLKRKNNNKLSSFAVNMFLMNANVNGKKKFEVTKNNETLSVDGVKTNLSWEFLSDKRILLREGNHQFEAELISLDMSQKQAEITIKGNVYTVDLKEDFDALLEKLGMGAGVSAVQSKVKAPMPGLVLEIFVKEGQEVTKDEPLLILEAMKMENVIKAPRDGQIKSIGVIKGNAIEKNTLLVEFLN